MPMQVALLKKPKSTVTVKASLSAEEFTIHIQQVTQQAVAKAELPGFRKGKAPEKMVVEKIGEATLLEEAASEALNKVYPTILKEHHIDAIGHPHVRITKLARGNPLEFEAEIAVLPEITLPDYKDMATKKNAEQKKEIIITDEELNKTIDWLQKSRAAKNGETTELTNEFAQSLGAYNTVDDLKNSIRENMKFEKEQKARDERRMELLGAVAEKTTIELPDILVESEKEKMGLELKNGVESIGMTWEAYLSHIKKTQDDLNTEWQKDAEKRAASALILREIAKNEHIEPSDDELNAWVYNYLASRDESEKKNIDLVRVKEYAYGVLRNIKVFEFLERINE
ncbi:MAG: FKBP-type peptidyl-prolyl cis-trans isomerase, trigger factor [Parcubacteria group bacterium Gr01-1014_29]|nr:MAG: FKBP-type peptidyl-prolyl cis-trans isomerase, trigger factor [Parcubacteria group bacterium Gr01-1014_29]